jgi:hypothetical protein
MSTGGIVFFQSEHRAETVEFYVEAVGAEVWREQVGCTILRHGNMLFGFCDDDDDTDRCGILTFVYGSAEEVDQMYARLEDVARAEPHENSDYEIYQFFADDPDGRTVEFQTFRHRVTDPL